MLGRFVLVIGSILFTLVVVELGARLVRGPEWLGKWQNLVLVEREGFGTRDGRFVYDAELGFISTPGFDPADINYDAHGYRMGPALPQDEAAKPPIVALAIPTPMARKWPTAKPGRHSCRASCTGGSSMPVSRPMASTRRSCASSAPWPS